MANRPYILAASLTSSGVALQISIVPLTSVLIIVSSTVGPMVLVIREGEGKGGEYFDQPSLLALYLVV